MAKIIRNMILTFIAAVLCCITLYIINSQQQVNSEQVNTTSSGVYVNPVVLVPDNKHGIQQTPIQVKE